MPEIFQKLVKIHQQALVAAVAVVQREMALHLVRPLKKMVS
jgi:hypothetical protein